MSSLQVKSGGLSKVTFLCGRYKFSLVDLQPTSTNRRRNGGDKNLITESAPTVTCLGTVHSIIHISRGASWWKSFLRKEMFLWNILSGITSKLRRHSAQLPGTSPEISSEAVWVDRKIKWVSDWTSVKRMCWGNTGWWSLELLIVKKERVVEVTVNGSKYQSNVCLK